MIFQTGDLRSAYGGVKAEIINLNHDYKVAFTDLGQDQVHSGDFVEIQTDRKKVFLMVDEVTSVLARLIPSQDPRYMTDLEGFREIAIGDPVVQVINREVRDETKLLITEKVPATELLSYQAEVERLKKELELKEQSLNDLRRDNQVLRQQVSRKMLDDYTQQKDCESFKAERDQLKNTVGLLEQKLRMMREVIEKNFTFPE